MHTYILFPLHTVSINNNYTVDINTTEQYIFQNLKVDSIPNTFVHICQHLVVSSYKSCIKRSTCIQELSWHQHGNALLLQSYIGLHVSSITV